MQDEGLELVSLDDDAAYDDAVDDGGKLREAGEQRSDDDGSQPLHDARSADADDDQEADDEPERSAVREIYRYSLGRATQDASPGRLERWVDRARHAEDPRRDR